MTLDSRFVIASDLQSLFRDKDTGLPLRNGVIYFWEDEARTIPKDVYKLSGSPPNYTYTNIGAVVNLTAAGTFSDNENPANDIVPYYFPYQGTPSQDTGITELYYVEVYSEGGKTSGVLQFTREAWPNIATAQSESQNLQNYIPNGQFKIHSNIPPDDTTTPPLVAGQIRQAVTNLAQGGWTFERPNASAAKDIVLFEPFGSYVTNPPSSPTYFIDIANQSPSAGDAYKDLRIKFNDVNKFASDTQLYTFAFWGQSNGGSVNVSLILIKNFGTGGTPSPSEEIPIANFIITNSFTVIQKSGFPFENNTGKTLGTNGDDFIQLALRFPTGSLFDVSLVDFILTPGSITVTNFPQTTDSEFGFESIAPPVPAYDNSNLFLPMVLGSQGVIYDNACIGDVVSETQTNIYVNSLHPTSNRLLANGSKYETVGYSPLGIPYGRLQQKYWNTTINAPIYGTGNDYVITYLINISPATNITLVRNESGSTANTADGTPGTGFSFGERVVGLNTGLSAFRVGLNSGNAIFAIDDAEGILAAPTAGDSGFTVQDYINAPDVRHQFIIEPIAATGLASKYFKFTTSLGTFYIWYKVNGAGTDPTPGGTGIEVQLLSSMGADEVTSVTAQAMFGFQVSSIVCTAGSTVPAGSYFIFDAPPSAQYYAWFTVDGVGTDPAPSGRIGIRCDILSTDTAVQVTSKLLTALNRKYFAVPNLLGLFLRGVSTNSIADPDQNLRFSRLTNYFNTQVGTSQFDTFAAHDHDYDLTDVNNNSTTWNSGSGLNWALFSTTTPTSYTGRQETRPKNEYVTYAILY